MDSQDSHTESPKNYKSSFPRYEVKYPNKNLSTAEEWKIFTFEIILPRCNEKKCKEKVDFYTRPNPLEFNHDQFENAVRIVGVVSGLTGFGKWDTVNVIPLQKDSTFEEPKLITNKQEKPITIHVRWFYTRNWQEVELGEEVKS